MTEWSNPPQKGDILVTEILDVGERDTCYGRCGGGMAVFVRGPVAIGDRAEVEVLKAKRNHLRARLRKIISPSPHRVEPRCAHFGTCGGCKWQHVSYDEQLRVKRKHVADALAHIGGFTDAPVEPVVPCPDTYHYRNKMEFSFSRRRYLLAHEQNEGTASEATPFALGLHVPRLFDKVVDIERCHIAPEQMNVVLAAVRAFAGSRGLTAYSTRSHDGFLRNLVIRRAQATGQLMVNLVTSWHDEALMQALATRLQDALGPDLTTFVNNVTSRKNNVAIGDHEHVVFGPGTIEEQLGPFRFTISANSFFQTNTGQAERLCETVLELADLAPQDLLCDLYAGTGAITIYLAGRCRQAVGMEALAVAVADAERNAARNGLKNCTFHCADLGKVTQATEPWRSLGRPDVVVANPPRAGVHPKALKALLNLRPRTVVYVSCNPTSLARDAAMLCEDGSYQLDRIVPIDMFPHTNHIESVVRLVRREAQ